MTRSVLRLQLQMRKLQQEQQWSQQRQRWHRWRLSLVAELVDPAAGAAAAALESELWSSLGPCRLMLIQQQKQLQLKLQTQLQKQASQAPGRGQPVDS